MRAVPFRSDYDGVVHVGRKRERGALFASQAGNDRERSEIKGKTTSYLSNLVCPYAFIVTLCVVLRFASMPRNTPRGGGGGVGGRSVSERPAKSNCEAIGAFTYRPPSGTGGSNSVVHARTTR